MQRFFVLALVLFWSGFCSLAESDELHIQFPVLQSGEYVATDLVVSLQRFSGYGGDDAARANSLSELERRLAQLFEESKLGAPQSFASLWDDCPIGDEDLQGFAEKRLRFWQFTFGLEPGVQASYKILDWIDLGARLAAVMDYEVPNGQGVTRRTCLVLNRSSQKDWRFVWTWEPNAETALLDYIFSTADSKEKPVGLELDDERAKRNTVVASWPFGRPGDGWLPVHIGFNCRTLPEIPADDPVAISISRNASIWQEWNKEEVDEIRLEAILSTISEAEHADILKLKSRLPAPRFAKALWTLAFTNEPYLTIESGSTLFVLCRKAGLTQAEWDKLSLTEKQRAADGRVVYQFEKQNGDFRRFRVASSRHYFRSTLRA